MIVVIGAGLTGLSAAFHLEGEEVVVLEREDAPGGLCRSVISDGFTFDLTGHLLHLRSPEIRDLVAGLLPEDAFNRIRRRSFVHSHGVFTPYPFQVNTHGLPPEVTAECLIGFMEAVREGELDAGKLEGISFKDWAKATFGEGVARHFMYPYNEKLWLTDLSEMTCEWVSWAVPRPSVRDVVEGALGISKREFGYNPSFLYPRRGGIAVLPEALASRVKGVRYGTEVTRVDASRRTVTARARDGGVAEEIPFTKLVSTMPLPVLLRLTEGLPPSLRSVAGSLRHVEVLNVNLGVERERLTEMHWAYFPEPGFPFYRCGFPANFSSETVPSGHSSIYVEVSVRPGQEWNEEDLAASCREGLIRCGILRPEDRIVTRRTFRISPAYVIYDRYRMRHLDPALRELASMGIHSAGRYGAWYYNSMEDSLAEGRKVALGLRERS